MVAGDALSSPMAENFKVYDIPPSVSPPVSAPDIQILLNENEGQFGIGVKQLEIRPGIFSRMSHWFRSR